MMFGEAFQELPAVTQGRELLPLQAVHKQKRGIEFSRERDGFPICARNVSGPNHLFCRVDFNPPRWICGPCSDVGWRRIIQELSPDGGGEHRFVRECGEQIDMV